MRNKLYCDTDKHKEVKIVVYGEKWIIDSTNNFHPRKYKIQISSVDVEKYDGIYIEIKEN